MYTTRDEAGSPGLNASKKEGKKTQVTRKTESVAGCSRDTQLMISVISALAPPAGTHIIQERLGASSSRSLPSSTQPLTTTVRRSLVTFRTRLTTRCIERSTLHTANHAYYRSAFCSGELLDRNLPGAAMAAAVVVVFVLFAAMSTTRAPAALVEQTFVVSSMHILFDLTDLHIVSAIS